MTERRCPTCSKPIEGIHPHRICNTCRTQDRCVCGRLKQRQSRTCSTCRSEAGTSNGNWRGGRTRHKKGYVLVRAPHHPRAQANGGYVFEHVLVMEDHLGRHLQPGETIHHLNGVKDDNRIENLELWTRPQPSGIRVSDAITWAREILRRYGAGPDTTTPTDG